MKLSWMFSWGGHPRPDPGPRTIFVGARILGHRLPWQCTRRPHASGRREVGGWPGSRGNGPFDVQTVFRTALLLWVSGRHAPSALRTGPPGLCRGQPPTPPKNTFCLPNGVPCRGRTVRCACTVRKVGHFGPVSPDGQGDRCVTTVCPSAGLLGFLLGPKPQSQSSLHFTANARLLSESAVVARRT